MYHDGLVLNSRSYVKTESHKEDDAQDTCLQVILGIDRFMSECRSLTNFIGNAVATVVVTRWEGALDREQFDAALAGELPSVDKLDPAEIAA